MTTATIAPSQRFTRYRPCPVCGGYDADRRGRSQRCYGFLSDDGAWAYCTREEYAGSLSENPNTHTYRHRLDGPCHCGHEHGAPIPITPRAKPSEPRPVEPKTGPLPRIYKGGTFAAEYHYRRADGSLAYRVARYEYPLNPGDTKPSKTFSQVRQISPNTWEWGLADTERVLYRLPELLASPPVQTVFVVEGEKAADALAVLGAVATTCNEGAGKWCNVPGRHDALRGRHVVILPDNDKPGRDHGAQIAADLAGVAASVRVVNLPNLPDAGDVVEWLFSGGSVVQLLYLAIATPAYQDDGTAQSRENCPGSQVDPLGTQAALKMAETTVHNLRARDAWESRLRRNPQLRGNYKTTLAHVFDEWHSRQREPQSYMRVYRPTYAEKLGVSEKSVSTHLAKLEDAGAIERYTETTYDPATGLARKHLSIRPTDKLLQHPDEIAMPGWGGKRALICSACGSDDLIERKQIICHHCGEIQSTTERPLNRYAPDEDDAGDVSEDDEQQTADTAQSRNSCPGSQVDPLGTQASQSAPDDELETPPERQPEGDIHLPSVYGYVPNIGNKAQDRRTWIIETWPEIPPGIEPAPGVPPEDMCVDGHRHRWIDTHCIAQGCGATRRREAVSA